MAEIPKPANLAVRGGVWFAAGDRQVHLGIEDDFRPARKAHPALRVVDLGAFRSCLTEGGYAPYEDEPLPGYRRFYVADPFGNRLEFIEPADATVAFEPERRSARGGESARQARRESAAPEADPSPATAVSIAVATSPGKNLSPLPDPA